jgi:hypothetical protein
MLEDYAKEKANGKHGLLPVNLSRTASGSTENRDVQDANYLPVVL